MIVGLTFHWATTTHDENLKHLQHLVIRHNLVNTNTCSCFFFRTISVHC